jgi:hypothetical protein
VALRPIPDPEPSAFTGPLPTVAALTLHEALHQPAEKPAALSLEEAKVKWGPLDDKLHPRWPKGTPGGRGGRFMKVGQRFLSGGKEWEIVQILNGHVYAQEASGKASKAELKDFEPTIKGKFPDEHGKPEQGVALDVEMAPPHYIEGGGHKGENMGSSTVTIVDPTVDHASHDPSIELPEDSPISDDEWLRFGRLEQLHYLDVQQRMGKWHANSASGMIAEAYTHFDSSIQSLVSNAYSSQYGSSDGWTISLTSHFKNKETASPEELAKLNEEREKARELQAMIGDIYAWDLYNRTHAPDVTVMHGSKYHSPNAWQDIWVDGDSPVFSGLSMSWHHNAPWSFSHKNAIVMIPLSIRHVVMSTFSGGPEKGGTGEFASEREISLPFQMTLDPDKTLVLDKSAIAGERAKWLKQMTQSQPQPGSLVETFRGALNGTIELDFPPPAANVQMDDTTTQPPPPDAAAAMSDIAKFLPGEQNDVFDPKDLPLDIPWEFTTDDGLPEATIAAESGYQVGDYMMGLKGTFYWIGPNPAGGFGLRYHKLVPVKDGDGNVVGVEFTGESWEFEGGGANSYFKIKGNVKPPKVEREGVEFDPAAWAFDEGKAVAIGKSLAEGDKFKANGDTYELMEDPDNKINVKIVNVENGKTGTINADYQAVKLIPAEGYIPPSQLKPAKGLILPYNGKKAVITNVTKSGVVSIKPQGAKVVKVEATAPELADVYDPDKLELTKYRANLGGLKTGTMFQIGKGEQTLNPAVVLNNDGTWVHWRDMNTGEFGQSLMKKQVRLINDTTGQDESTAIDLHAEASGLGGTPAAQVGDLPIGAQFKMNPGGNASLSGTLTVGYIEGNNIMVLGDTGTKLTTIPKDHMVTPLGVGELKPAVEAKKLKIGEEFAFPPGSVLHGQRFTVTGKGGKGGIVSAVPSDQPDAIPTRILPGGQVLPYQPPSPPGSEAPIDEVPLGVHFMTDFSPEVWVIKGRNGDTGELTVMKVDPHTGQWGDGETYTPEMYEGAAPVKMVDKPVPDPVTTMVPKAATQGKTLSGESPFTDAKQGPPVRLKTLPVGARFFNEDSQIEEVKSLAVNESTTATTVKTVVLNDDGSESHEKTWMTSVTNNKVYPLLHPVTNVDIQALPEGAHVVAQPLAGVPQVYEVETQGDGTRALSKHVAGKAAGEPLGQSDFDKVTLLPSTADPLPEGYVAPEAPVKAGEQPDGSMWSTYGIIPAGLPIGSQFIHEGTDYQVTGEMNGQVYARRIADDGTLDSTVESFGLAKVRPLMEKVKNLTMGDLVVGVYGDQALLHRVVGTNDHMKLQPVHDSSVVALSVTEFDSVRIVATPEAPEPTAEPDGEYVPFKNAVKAKKKIVGRRLPPGARFVGGTGIHRYQVLRHESDLTVVMEVAADGSALTGDEILWTANAMSGSPMVEDEVTPDKMNDLRAGTYVFATEATPDNGDQHYTYEVLEGVDGTTAFRRVGEGNMMATADQLSDMFILPVEGAMPPWKSTGKKPIGSVVKGDKILVDGKVREVYADPSAPAGGKVTVTFTDGHVVTETASTQVGWTKNDPAAAAPASVPSGYLHGEVDEPTGLSVAIGGLPVGARFERTANGTTDRWQIVGRDDDNAFMIVRRVLPDNDLQADDVNMAVEATALPLVFQDKIQAIPVLGSRYYGSADGLDWGVWEVTGYDGDDPTVRPVGEGTGEVKMAEAPKPLTDLAFHRRIPTATANAPKPEPTPEPEPSGVEMVASNTTPVLLTTLPIGARYRYAGFIYRVTGHTDSGSVESEPVGDEAASEPGEAAAIGQTAGEYGDAPVRPYASKDLYEPEDLPNGAFVIGRQGEDFLPYQVSVDAYGKRSFYPIQSDLTTGYPYSANLIKEIRLLSVDPAPSPEEQGMVKVADLKEGDFFKAGDGTTYEVLNPTDKSEALLVKNVGTGHTEAYDDNIGGAAVWGEKISPPGGDTTEGVTTVGSRKVGAYFRIVTGGPIYRVMSNDAGMVKYVKIEDGKATENWQVMPADWAVDVSDPPDTPGVGSEKHPLKEMPVGSIYASGKDLVGRFQVLAQGKDPLVAKLDYQGEVVGVFNVNSPSPAGVRYAQSEVPGAEWLGMRVIEGSGVQTLAVSGKTLPAHTPNSDDSVKVALSSLKAGDLFTVDDGRTAMFVAENTNTDKYEILIYENTDAENIQSEMQKNAEVHVAKAKVKGVADPPTAQPLPPAPDTSTIPHISEAPFQFEPYLSAGSHLKAGEMLKDSIFQDKTGRNFIIRVPGAEPVVTHGKKNYRLSGNVWVEPLPNAVWHANLPDLPAGVDPDPLDLGGSNASANLTQIKSMIPNDFKVVAKDLPNGTVLHNTGAEWSHKKIGGKYYRVSDNTGKVMDELPPVLADAVDATVPERVALPVGKAYGEHLNGGGPDTAQVISEMNAGQHQALDTAPGVALADMPVGTIAKIGSAAKPMRKLDSGDWEILETDGSPNGIVFEGSENDPAPIYAWLPASPTTPADLVGDKLDPADAVTVSDLVGAGPNHSLGGTGFDADNNEFKVVGTGSTGDKLNHVVIEHPLGRFRLPAETKLDGLRLATIGDVPVGGVISRSIMGEEHRFEVTGKDEYEQDLTTIKALDQPEGTLLAEFGLPSGFPSDQLRRPTVLKTNIPMRDQLNDGDLFFNWGVAWRVTEDSSFATTVEHVQSGVRYRYPTNLMSTHGATLMDYPDGHSLHHLPVGVQILIPGFWPFRVSTVGQMPDGGDAIYLQKDLGNDEWGHEAVIPVETKPENIPASGPVRPARGRRRGPERATAHQHALAGRQGHTFRGRPGRGRPDGGHLTRPKKQGRGRETRPAGRRAVPGQHGPRPVRDKPAPGDPGHGGRAATRRRV